MKNDLAKTENRLKLSILFDQVNSQDSLTPVKMALITGHSGSGKTVSVANLAANTRVSAVYVTCSINDTPNSLLSRICKELGAAPKRRTVDMQEFIIEKMGYGEYGLRQPLFVDEVNSLFESSRSGIPPRALIILETLRYIHDRARIPVLLVGTNLVKERLSHHEQLDRRLQHLEFSPMSLQDAHSVVKACGEISIEEGAIEDAYLATAASIGRFTVHLAEMERYCISQGWEMLTHAQYKTWMNQKGKGKKGGVR